MGQEKLRNRPQRLSWVSAKPESHARPNAGTCLPLGFFRVLALFMLGIVGTFALFGAALPVAAATKKLKAATTTTEPAAKTFCEGWSQVRAVRSTGLTGIAVLRLQAERYRALVELAPKDLRPQVKVMADYFMATLAIADKPLNNAKQSAALEALIPKIGDALTAVTRHAVRSCPRSLVLSTTTIAPGTPITTVTTTTTATKTR